MCEQFFGVWLDFILVVKGSVVGCYIIKNTGGNSKMGSDVRNLRLKVRPFFGPRVAMV
jgi:hypothetical protein